ncbi:MAG: nucleotidyltransferase domain-containing protein [Thermofilum sp.]
MLGELQGLNSVNVPSELKEILGEFVEKVKAQLGPAEVYLFGSYARGDWLRDSDVDLIVVSPAFQGLDLGKRYSLVRRLLPDTISVELLLYTPEEFERLREKSVVLRDAARYWVKLL